MVPIATEVWSECFLGCVENLDLTMIMFHDVKVKLIL